MSDIPMRGTEWANSDRELHRAMGGVRASWRKRVILEGAAWAATAMLVALVLLALVGLGSRVTPQTFDSVRWAFWGLGLLSVAWWVVRPLVRSVSESNLARYMEERDPEIGQVLLSAVDAAREPMHNRASPALVNRLVSQATGELARHENGSALEAPRVRRAAFHLGLTLLGSLLLLQFGPGQWRSMARGLMTPWTPADQIVPDRFVTVEPGNITLARGASVDVSASTTNFSPDNATALIRQVGTDEWRAIPMLSDSTGHFSLRLFDLDASTEYRIEAAEIASNVFRITVTDLPAVRQLDVTLNFPEYTGLSSEQFEDGGDIASVVGTRVELIAQTTMPVGGAVLRFDDGNEVPFTVSDSSLPSASFQVTRNSFYSIDLIAPDGTVVPGSVRWAIDALPDRAPVVRVFEPGRDSKATNVEEVGISIGADDDYGVAAVELRYSINGGEESAIVLDEGLPPGTLTPRSVYMMYLEEFPLSAGDLVSYYGVARDGAGNSSESDIYFIEIRPFSKNFRQSEQGAAPPGAGEQGEPPQDLSRMQREIAVATFNLVRDSADADQKRFVEDVATVAVEQAEVRDRISELAGEIGARGAAASDSTFEEVKQALDSAVVMMRGALETLNENRLRDALPWQQGALQQLLRSESLYRDVELQVNNGEGGGGGGGGAAPEDLADLFELETDKLRNQYEAVQNQASTPDPGTAAIDSARERLKELARRLEQENERQQRMAEAMQQRMAQQGGQAAAGGAGGSASAGSAAAQRRMADEAEEEARRLERLAREQQSPELEQAAQAARNAADNLRRAASGEQGRASDAAESLRDAASGAESGRQSTAERQAEAAAQSAERLAREQRRFAEEATRMPVPGSGERADAAAELQRRGEQLTEEARKLVAELDQTGRNLRGTDPRAATEFGDAAGQLRRMQVPERMEQGARLVGDDRFPPSQIKEFNDEITKVLEAVGEQVRGAAGTIGGSPEQQRSGAMEQARELVRAAESMLERTAGNAARDSLASPSGQGQGQGQEEGEGQNGQQGQPGQGQEGPGQDGQGQDGQGQPGDNPNGDQRSSPSGDARQLSGEVAVRLRAAQELSGELREQGVQLESLENAIESMQRLLQRGLPSEATELAQLQQELLTSLQDAEFDLWQRWGGGASGRPAVGDPSRVPPRFRQMVEEYYRAIARDKP